MTSCPFGYQIGESGHQRPKATTTGVLPPATRLVRTVRGCDANSRPSPEIGKGDPSKCCTGVQTSAMPVVPFPLKLRAHDPRRWRNAPRPLSRPAPDFRVAIGENPQNSTGSGISFFRAHPWSLERSSPCRTWPATPPADVVNARSRRRRSRAGTRRPAHGYRDHRRTR